jgi:DNA-binding response OmpR family regulator
MSAFTKPSVLAIGIDGLSDHRSTVDLYTADTLREAVATIRLVCFDLLVIGLDNPRLDVWELIDRLLAAWPGLRWLLASRRVTVDEEVQARSRGALMVLHRLPDEAWLADIVASLRRRDVSNSVVTLAALDGEMPLPGAVRLQSKAS